jgi:hypothetical protein
MPCCCCYVCRLQQELELQQHSLELLTARVQGSEGAQLAEAVAATEAALKAAEEEAAAAAGKKRDMVALAKVGQAEGEGSGPQGRGRALWLFRVEQGHKGDLPLS